MNNFHNNTDYFNANCKISSILKTDLQQNAISTS